MNYSFSWNGTKNYPFVYDDPVAVMDECKPTTEIIYAYNAQGQQTSMRHVEVTIDSLGQLIERDQPYIYTRYQYLTTAGSKIFGALTSAIDSLNRETKYYYDTANGRLLASVNVRSGDGICYSYDAIGNLISAMPAEYSSSTSSYTATSGAEQVEYSYNSRNFLESITTESTTYTFAYDSFGNTSSTSVGSQELASYTYNSYNGKLNKIEYGNGFVVQYVYDTLDNLTEIWYNDGGNDYQAYAYTYTDRGQLAQLDNLLTDKSTIYTYDATGKLIGYAECDSNSKIISNGVQLSYNDYSQIQSQFQYLDYACGTAVGNHCVYYHYTYNDDGTLEKTTVKLGDGIAGDVYRGSAAYTYDAYNRLTGVVTNISDDNNSSTKFTHTVSYGYTTIINPRINQTSTQVKSYTTQVNSNAAKAYTYTYDDNGNITSISLGGVEQYRYKYDDVGQLTREDNTVSGKTYTYTYDNAGNILSKKTYALTAAGTEPSSPTSTKTYTYGNANWGDQLTAFNGVTITYDAIGNPLTYFNGATRTLTWKNGRQLATYTSGSTSISFEYNDEGIRTSKTVGSTTYKYYLNGSQIVAEEWGNKLLIYLYDANGSPIGMQYRTTSYAEGVFDTYWFEKNLQGDIVAVYSDAGTLLATYAYDAWGNTVSTTYSNGGSGTIVRNNRFRYRGYYYDTETGFYYLNSRYYDPSTGRFINADVYTDTGTGIVGNNMYAYCNNDPICSADPYGQVPSTAIYPVCWGGNGYKLVSGKSDGKYLSNILLEDALNKLDPTMIPSQSTIYVSAQVGQCTIPIKTELDKITAVTSTVTWLGGPICSKIPVVGRYLSVACFVVSGVSSLYSLYQAYAPEEYRISDITYDQYSVSVSWSTVTHPMGYPNVYIYTEHCITEYYRYNNGLEFQYRKYTAPTITYILDN